MSGQPNEARAVAHVRSGLFVTFEGGEGVGKSTQVARLAERLRRLGRKIVVTREPGGSQRAEALRAVLLAGRVKSLGPFAEAALFAAARADHVERLIRPALREGAVVLCDRFIDSTRVYQGALGAVAAAALARLEDVTVADIRPDVTLVLDVPAETGLARAIARRSAQHGRPDRFEGEGGNYHQRVRQAFLAGAAAEPGRCRVIDGSAGPDVVEAAIWAALKPTLSAAGQPA